ncbi:MAG: glutamate synthase central domain-containing protein [Victivallis sp.]
MGSADFLAKVPPLALPLGRDGRMLDRRAGDAPDAVAAVKNGKNCRILILSDRNPSRRGRRRFPPLLATAAVNRALAASGLRPGAGIIVQSGEIREIMHYALLLGFGATAINPYLALETISTLTASGKLKLDPARAVENYINAVDKGLLKVMSKMGISTLRSYRSAQIFEAVGIDRSVIDRYFPERHRGSAASNLPTSRKK